MRVTTRVIFGSMSWWKVRSIFRSSLLWLHICKHSCDKVPASNPVTAFLLKMCVSGDRAPAYVFVFPNLMINRYGPWMDTNVVQPTSPTTCTVRFDWWLEPRLANDDDVVQQASLTLAVLSRSCQ